MIEIRKISKIYGNSDLIVKAVDEVTLDITQGEFTAIVGPSGSGKTTLLNMIGGLDEPSFGSVALNGREIQKMSGRELSDFRRDNIGFVFQSYNLIPVLNVAENIEYVMLLQGVPKKERENRVSQILLEVDLIGKEKRYPRELSGGQQQRVAVARALVARPQIILADEPTANLDSKTATDLIEMMRKLNKDRMVTFVFSTHDLKIMDRAKRIVYLKDGKIEKDERH
ncbi:MAG: ABC transporter ATP-binding protein [Oligoflexales bacterium]|nr:ABC transporter ATP-binding protein [Oligoflexales bacterium]